MSFGHPLSLLLLLLVPPIWIWLRSSWEASRVSATLKCVVLAFLVIALADPRINIRANKLTIAVLIDTSASMPRAALDRGEAMLRDLAAKGSRADLRLITFAGHPNLQPISEQPGKTIVSRAVDRVNGMATDLESAIQLAIDTLPSQGARRVLLITDGNETRGHALTAATIAGARGIAVYTVPSGGTSPLPVKVESVSAPRDVLSGEHFNLSLQLVSARELSARVWVTSQGREIGSITRTLQAGINDVDLVTQLANTGVNLLEAHISSNGTEQVLVSQPVTVRKPRVLYIAGGEPSAPLLATLKQSEVDVEQAYSFPTEASRGKWDAVLLDNYPDHPLPAGESAALEKYVYTGGGLLFIAGDKNAKLAREPKTPFEKLLPVRGRRLPKKPIAVVLVLDKSQSMEGVKIQMVRAAARGSILALRPFDKLGVISFNVDFDWVVPLGPATDLERKADLIDEIQATGETKIWQATQAGFDAIVKEEASSRHIILLTDGQTSDDVVEYWPELEQQAVAQHVTISTIGIGVYVNRRLLEEIATATKGKSHMVQDPDLVPEIVNDEVTNPDDLSIQERPVRVLPVRPADITDGIDFSTAPRLLGFVQSEAKDGAETILRLSGDEPVPLLVRWHYGLGSATAFLSDDRSRWAEPWMHWKSFGTLWPQMVRYASHRDMSVHAEVREGRRDGEAIVSYNVLPAIDKTEEAKQHAGTVLSLPGEVRVVVEAPDKSSRQQFLEETSPGHYETRIAAEQPGLYRITSGNPDVELPELGFYRESEETRAQPVNLSLLGDISRVSGGRVRPSIDELLSNQGALANERRSVWSYFLLFALALNFVELGIRKGFLEWLMFQVRRRAMPSWRRQSAG